MQTLEGDWKPKRIVVTEFPSIEQARGWYDSEEYRPLKALRLRTARGSIVLVEGVSWSFSSFSNQYVMPIAPYIALAVVRCSWACSGLPVRP